MQEITDKYGHSVQMRSLSEAVYKDKENNEYIIGIEGLIDNGIAIYSDNVYLNQSKTTHITKEKKKEIIDTAVKLFQSAGMRIELF